MKALLKRLLNLLPVGLREQFGTEMADQLDRDYDRARLVGVGAAIWFTLGAGWDLVRSSIAERWNPSWRRAQTQTTKTKGFMSTIDDWTRDLRQAVRSLIRSPGFTAVAVGTLGLAIGANASIFTAVQAVLLNPLPYPEVDRIVDIVGTAPGSELPAEFELGNEFYVQYKERSRLLEDVAIYNSFTATLRVDDRVERIRMSWPTNSLYNVLGATPLIGRLPVVEDEDRTAVISYQLWSSWFGSDSSVIGRGYEINGQRRTIIGVMKPEFRFPNDGTLLWISNDVRADGIEPGRFANPLVARMAPGATSASVAEELTSLARQLPERFGGTPTYARIIEHHRAVVRTIEDRILGPVAGPLWVLLGAAAVVLLIACANVANLFAVRAEGRQGELALRRAIGAGRGQLIESQMAEAVIVALLAGIVAAAIAWTGLPAFLRAAPGNIPRLDEVGFGPATLAFTLVVALGSAMACGLLPAIRASAPDLRRLREGGRGSTRQRHWTRNGLVIAQTALALVLLIGSGLLIRSFRQLSQVDPGYETKDVFTFQIAPDEAALTDGPSFAQFQLAFLDRLAAIPGVASVGLIENVPLNEKTRPTRFRTEEMGSDPDAGTIVNFTFTAGDYFKTMGIKMVAGRPFERADHALSSRSVVISRSAANLLWPAKDPLGRRVQRAGSTEWATVVGVVEDVMQDNFRDPPRPLVYLPLVGPTPRSWIVSSPAYVVKTSRAETIGPEIRALVREVAPSAPMYRVYTMAGLAADSMVQLTFTMLTLGIVSSLALILGAVGLYGVLSYVVAERTREIGVRMALGAQASQVRRMVVVQGARVVAVGVLIGVTVAAVAARTLGSLLFGVAAIDPFTFAGMSVLLVAVGMLASYLPARRASTVDPIESLRGG